MTLSFSAKWKQDFRKSMGAAARAPRLAATRGMKITIDGQSGLKSVVRGQVRSAGLGPKVANTVRSAVYPTKGESTSPAGTVFSKAPQILVGFEEGSVIRPKGGKRYLAIPTKQCPRDGTKRRLKPAKAITRFSEPRVIKLRGGGFLWLFQTVTSSSGRIGRFRQNKKGTKRSNEIPFYVLKPLTKLPKRLDLNGALRSAGSKLNSNIAAAWPADQEL